MKRRNIYLILISLILVLGSVQTSLMYKRQNAEFENLYENISDICKNTIVKVDGKELQLKINNLVKSTSELKKMYKTDDTNIKKTALFTVSTINDKDSSESKNTKPLIVKLSRYQGAWTFDKQEITYKIVEYLLRKDFETEYSKITGNTSGLEKTTIYKNDSMLDSIVFSSEENGFKIKYKMINVNKRDVYEFEKHMYN